jgi:hypothetical protein
MFSQTDGTRQYEYAGKGGIFWDRQPWDFKDQKDLKDQEVLVKSPLVSVLLTFSACGIPGGYGQSCVEKPG